MSIAGRMSGLVADLKQTGFPVTAGPPHGDLAPSAPCYVVGVPTITDVVNAGTGCEVSGTSVDVFAVPTRGDDPVQLAEMADTAVGVLRGQITSGAVEPSPFTFIDTYVYRITVEDL